MATTHPVKLDELLEYLPEAKKNLKNQLNKLEGKSTGSKTTKSNNSKKAKTPEVPKEIDMIKEETTEKVEKCFKIEKLSLSKAKKKVFCPISSFEDKVKYEVKEIQSSARESRACGRKRKSVNYNETDSEEYFFSIESQKGKNLLKDTKLS